MPDLQRCSETNSMPTVTLPSPSLPWEALARPRSFWFAMGGLVILVGACIRQVDDSPAFLLIAFTALLPAFLWCHGIAHGIPIYPLFTLGTLWTFGLPLLSGSAAFSVESCWQAALVIALTNLAGTAVWLGLTRVPGVPFRSYCGFRPRLADRIFVAALAVEILFQLITSSVNLGLDPALFSILRAMILAWGTLGVFVLGFRAGSRDLSRQMVGTYLLLLAGVLLSTLSSVLLAGSIYNSMLALISFALGRGRLPLLPSAAFIVLALFLQAGKSSVRAAYWPGIEGAPVTMSRFPGFLADWFTLSSRRIFPINESHGIIRDENSDEEPQSLLERASLLPLFLMIQRETPEKVPYLNGATYQIIPGLLVPRIFNEGKERSHFGTYLLSIHYGLQRPEDTSMTTIGFGLINEAFANFGRLGCLGLGAVLGAFYGGIARWSSSFPVLSWRGLFSILILATSIETEFTAGVFAATLFQSCCALLFLMPLARRINVFPSAKLPFFIWSRIRRESLSDSVPS